MLDVKISIELPPTIPKSSFERDLDYYGLVPNAGAIKTTSVAEVRASLLKEHLDATRKHDMLLMAIEVHHQYVLNFKKRTSDEYVQISGKEMRKALSQDHYDYLTGEEREMFLNYLDVYFGLRLAKKGDGIGSRDYPATLSGNFYVIKK